MHCCTLLLLLQLLCVPEEVTRGSVFHASMRWCLSRPRYAFLNMDILAVNAEGNYLTSGDGIATSAEWQVLTSIL
jgi:hypothetical protein